MKNAFGMNSGRLVSHNVEYNETHYDVIFASIFCEQSVGRVSQ
jgi:hypothetical protein